MNRVGRRAFLQTLVGVAVAVAVAACGGPPTTQRTPAPHVARVGVMGVGRPDAPLGPNATAFKQGLEELGYVEGRNLSLEWRWAAPDRELFVPLATELVQQPVDVLVTIALPALEAAQQVAPTTATVMVYSGDPVTAGLVPSLARPGGYVTGLSSMDSQLSGKRVELLSEALPGLTRVAVLWNPTQPDKLIDFEETRLAAQKLALQLHSAEARTPEELEGAIVAARQASAQGLVVLEDDLMFRERSRIAELELREHLPAIYAIRQHVVAGGLMAYGPNTPSMFRRAASYVDRILKGERPGDLPIEQPMRFDFVINLKTAQTLGLTLPQALLLDVTEVVQ